MASITNSPFKNGDRIIVTNPKPDGVPPYTVGYPQMGRTGRLIKPSGFGCGEWQVKWDTTKGFGSGDLIREGMFDLEDSIEHAINLAIATMRGA